MNIKLTNIGKLTSANISINAITVIAGENNTGKSTIGRALYLYLDSLKDIDVYVQNDMIITLNRSLSGVMDELDLMCRNYVQAARRRKVTKGKELREQIAVALVMEGGELKESIADPLLNQYAALYGISSLYELQNYNEEQFLAWKEHFKTAVDGVLRLDIGTLENRKVTSAVKMYFDENIITIGHEDENASITVVNDGYENSLSFSRNKKAGQDICSGITRRGNVIQSALYIDTPKILDDLSSFVRLTEFDVRQLIPLIMSPARFRNMTGLKPSFEDETNSEASQRDMLLGKFENEVVETAGGRLTLNRTAGLEFTETGSKRAVKMTNLSNGVKSLSVLEYAIRNGALKKGDFLILDEPEINLHPAWQVKYAKLLVELQKVLDLHILLTTHTPYFLEAVELFSRKGGIAEQTRFYASSVYDDGIHVDDVTENIDIIYDKLARPFQEMEDEQYN